MLTPGLSPRMPGSAGVPAGWGEGCPGWQAGWLGHLGGPPDFQVPLGQQGEQHLTWMDKALKMTNPATMETAMMTAKLAAEAAESRAKDLDEKKVELAQLMEKSQESELWCDIWSEPLSWDIWNQPGSCDTLSELTESCDISSELYVLKKTSFLKSFFLVSRFVIGHNNYFRLFLSC